MLGLVFPMGPAPALAKAEAETGQRITIVSAIHLNPLNTRPEKIADSIQLL